MSNVIAFIPAREESKSIPKKNIKSFCGKALIYWNLSALQQTNVDEIVVATDCVKTKEVVNAFNFSKIKIKRFIFGMMKKAILLCLIRDMLM